MRQFKRQYRELNDETKKQISLSLKDKPKSEIHKQHIQQSMLRYWSTVRHKPLSMDEYLNPQENSEK